MSPSHDPFDLIRQAAPEIDHDTASTPVEDAILDRVLQILDERSPRRRWWQRRRAIGGLIAIGAIGAASVSAAVWYETSRPDLPVSVTCWRDTERSSQWEAQIGHGDSPIDACAAAWHDGTFGNDGPPPLVACTSNEGRIAVVPGDSPDVCAALGLPVLFPGHETSPDVAEADLLQQFIADPLSATCASEDQTLALIDEVLTENDIQGWTVEVQAPFTADRPCGQVAIDPAIRTLSVFTLRKR